MCTVSFVPQPNLNFVLTSNRDEQLKRQSAFQPKIDSENGVDVLYPKDGEKGGTWIGVTNQNRVICLLNGAFSKHQVSPPYAKSRGIVVKDLLVCEDINLALQHYNFNNIEPFTLVIIEFKNKLQLVEFRWDGNQKHFKPLNEKETHIWSSCTLYTQEEAIHKSKQFETEIPTLLNAKQILHFHEYGNKQEPLLMKYTSNPKYATVSITQIIRKEETLEMIYKDLIEENIIKQNIKSKLCNKVVL